MVDAFETPTDYVVATKYLRGGGLLNRLREMHHYSEQVVARMAKSMLKALFYCHKCASL